MKQIFIITTVSVLLLSLCIPFSHAEENYRFQAMWPALKQPWYFYHPTGIAVDEEGYVYIANMDNDFVSKFTSNGEFVSRWGKQGNREGEFSEPFDIAADKDGFVYVTDMNNNRIQKFTSDGVFVMQWGKAGSGDGEFRRPHGIAVSFSGKVYAADTENSRIQFFTAEGKFVGKWEMAGTAGRFDLPQDVMVTQDGMIYVADTHNDRILKFDEKGNLISYWGVTQYPHGITSDMVGNVYVTDKFSSRIQKYSPTGQFLFSWGGKGNPDGMLDYPCGLAYGKDGHIYVADMNNQRIQKFTTEGQFADRWGVSGNPGFFNKPEGIAVSPDDFVFVCDTENHRIQKFSRSGRLETHWGQKGKAEREFDTPHGITVDKAGFVYVADTENHRIQKFSQEGLLIGKAWGKQGEQDGQFDLPYAITTDKEGYIYVTEWGNRRVQKFDAEGNFICKWGTHGSGDSEFVSPLGITADSNGFVYVTDAVNRSVQKFLANGTFADKWDQEDFKLPSGIAVASADGQDFIYVADSGNHRIQKFTSEGVFISQWGESGYMPGQMSYPGALAFDSDGNVFVADTDNHRIQIFRKSEKERTEKAIIIAGGGPYPGNRLWDATRLSANYAYHCLYWFRGFKKESIYYLSADTDDADADPSAAALQKAIRESDADRLVLYFVDHGGDAKFRLSESETLSASDLNTWLNDFQTGNSKEVIVIYDACNGGSFISGLEGNQSRILISASDVNENAHFIHQGSISFSSFFWTHLFNGLDVQTAFDKTADALSAFSFTQNPVMQKLGTFSDESENKPAEPVYIGSVSVIPQEETKLAIALTPDLSGESVLVDVSIDSPQDIARVWAVLIPPEYSQTGSDIPVLELPSAELFVKNEGTYQATISLNGKKGYSICAYARDRLGNTYASDSKDMNSSTVKKRRAVLVSSDTLSAASVQSAYHALKFQGYEEDAIQIFAPETVSGIPVKGNLSLAGLHQSIKDCTEENTLDLIIYLTGQGSDKGFQIRSSETLSAQSLNIWLNELQNRISGEVVVLYDADYAGMFLPELIPLEGKKRIVISGTSADGKRISDQNISFSAFFWKQIYSGDNLYRAFAGAKQSIQLLSQLPEDRLPLLDDNGNGMGNERTDGQRAMNFVIGNGIRLADNMPIVNEIQIESVLNGTASAAISADLSSFEHIDNAWAVISMPCHADDPEPATERIDLTEMQTKPGKYEGIYDRFNRFGIYPISVYAGYEGGNISPAKKSSVFQADGKDVYEPDDSLAQAGIITVDAPNPQHRSLHSSNDADWVKFYGIKGEIYTIRTANPGTNANHVPELYNSKGEIEKSHPAILCESGKNDNPHISCTMIWHCPENGIYYICVRPDSGASAQSAEYYLEIFTEKAVFPGWLKGIVTDAITGLPVSNVRIFTSIGSSSLSRPSGHYRIVQEPYENMKVTVEADGYISRIFENITVSEGGTRILDIFLQPVLGGGDWVDKCPDDPNKTEPGICGCGVPDKDTDGDGSLDCADKCPDDLNKTEPGICDCGKSEDDTDGDGFLNCVDKCPDDPNKTDPGVCGCGIADTDSDGDRAPDCKDECPDDPNKTEPGICGCGKSEDDTDGDGVLDCMDGCPNDPNKTEPGECGCGNPEPGENGLCDLPPPVADDADRDGDGVLDCTDGCPDDPDKTEPGICGCGISDTDTDNDGIPDCKDQCLNDPLKTEPGICGCGKADTDTDKDGTPDCNDGCPDDPNKADPGICGCNVSDRDDNGSGTADCLDKTENRQIIAPVPPSDDVSSSGCFIRTFSAKLFFF